MLKAWRRNGRFEYRRLRACSVNGHAMAASMRLRVGCSPTAASVVESYVCDPIRGIAQAFGRHQWELDSRRHDIQIDQATCLSRNTMTIN